MSKKYIFSLPRGKRTFSSLRAVGVWNRLSEERSSDEGCFLYVEEKWLIPTLPSLAVATFALKSWYTCG